MVELGIIRDDKLLKVLLIRDKIEINVVESRINNTISGAKIGYLRLKQFNAKSPKEMSLSIKKLEKQKPIGYVLDLRSNPGGLLEASIEIARQWINSGIIVSTKTKDGITDIRKGNSRALTNRPVVVLIDEGSASASEILSGAIKDNKRGLLVGKKTFGKGSVGDDLPSIIIKKEKIKNGINIIDLVISSNLLTSKSEIRRMIKNKGIKINNDPVKDDKLNISLENFNKESILKLSHGKKNHVIVKIN